MSNITAAQMMASPRFVEIATEDAVSLLAKKNGTSADRIMSAITGGHEPLAGKLSDLVWAAAEATAKAVNQKGWAA